MTTAKVIACVACKAAYAPGNQNADRSVVCRDCKPEYRRIYARMRRLGYPPHAAALRTKKLMGYSDLARAAVTKRRATQAQLPVRVQKAFAPLPGLAKTRLLRRCIALSPRGVFANASTSSKVGLTATTSQDDFAPLPELQWSRPLANACSRRASN